jgi:protein-disulfide isomerase
MKQVVLAILLMFLGVLETPAQSLQLEEILRVLGQGPAKGAESAPITTIEFSDFQCSYCRKFWNETLPRLEAEYVKPGKIRFIYRHLAILGEQSVSAGQAAECAREQGKFWEYHDRLFASQGPFAFTMGNLKHYAKELGLDIAAFNQCLASGKYAQKVDAETGVGKMLGLRGTPSFFINGRPLVGAQPYETFQLLIEDELEKAKSAKGPSRR